MKSTPFTEIVFIDVYPEENPEGWEENVARAMGYTGLLDGLIKEAEESDS